MTISLDVSVPDDRVDHHFSSLSLVESRFAIFASMFAMARNRVPEIRARGRGLENGAGGLIAAMTTEDIMRRLEILRVEHRDLDSAIGALAAASGDQLQVARLKKRKLRLRDEIAFLEDQLVPDIIA